MIEMDQHEYTLDDEDRKVQNVILKRGQSQHEAIVLKKSLSCSYPNMPVDEAIRKENQKLQLELQHSQANLDVGQCEVIQHLLEVTETVAATPLPEKSSFKKESKAEQVYTDVNSEKERSYSKKSGKPPPSRLLFYLRTKMNSLLLAAIMLSPSA